jgi:hypothetical protein
MDLKNRFRNDSSSDIDYSVKTIWNTTGKLLQEKCHDEHKLTFNPFCDGNILLFIDEEIIFIKL